MDERLRPDSDTPSPNHLHLIQAPLLARKRWVDPEELARSPLVWLLFSTLCGLLDFWSGPLVHFQIAYAIPISLGAWHRGLRWAIPMAILFSCLRLVFLEYETLVGHWMLTGANLGIRMGVLISLAFLVNHTAKLASQVAIWRVSSLSAPGANASEVRMATGFLWIAIWRNRRKC
jgi:hypothetical protein